MKLFSKNSNLCDHNPPTLQTDGQTDRQTDGRTDRQTTCDRNTALCTKVHSVVKTATINLTFILHTAYVTLRLPVRPEQWRQQQPELTSDCFVGRSQSWELHYDTQSPAVHCPWKNILRPHSVACSCFGSGEQRSHPLSD